MQAWKMALLMLTALLNQAPGSIRAGGGIERLHRPSSRCLHVAMARRTGQGRIGATRSHAQAAPTKRRRRRGG
jgi:hypothetical protein